MGTNRHSSPSSSSSGGCDMLRSSFSLQCLQKAKHEASVRRLALKSLAVLLSFCIALLARGGIKADEQPRGNLLGGVEENEGGVSSRSLRGKVGSLALQVQRRDEAPGAHLTFGSLQRSPREEIERAASSGGGNARIVRESEEQEGLEEVGEEAGRGLQPRLSRDWQGAVDQVAGNELWAKSKRLFWQRVQQGGARTLLDAADVDSGSASAASSQAQRKKKRKNSASGVRDVQDRTLTGGPGYQAANDTGSEETCKGCHAKHQLQSCLTIHSSPKQLQCDQARALCNRSNSIVNYALFHFCSLSGESGVSVPIMLLGVIAAFYLLADTAENFFCPVVTLISELLELAPNTAGVTFLAFGNGAPDVFSSLAAFVGGNPRIGVGAIVSAGSFVSCFVIGCVAMVAAPFPVKKTAFVRDNLCYFASVLTVFGVYMTGEVHLGQSLAMVLFYVIFVIIVVVSDKFGRKDMHAYRKQHDDVREDEVGGGVAWHGEADNLREHGVVALEKGYGDGELQISDEISRKGVPSDMLLSSGSPFRDLSKDSLLRQKYSPPDSESLKLQPTAATGAGADERSTSPRAFSPNVFSVSRSSRLVPSLPGILFRLLLHNPLAMTLQSILHSALFILHFVFDFLRRATIPCTDDSKFDRTFAFLNILLFPILLLYASSSFISPFSNATFFLPNSYTPLWFLVTLQSMVCALGYLVLNPHQRPLGAPKKITVFIAFFASVFWISQIAGELLGLLAALGVVLQVSPSILGLTVLAWGNSVGDLAADVAMARAGYPLTAVAGCFAGPMFNMMVGLGMALSVSTFMTYPHPHKFHYHPNIPIAFGFLLVSLLGSLAVVSWSRFHVARTWGYCLILMYISFMGISIYVESHRL